MKKTLFNAVAVVVCFALSAPAAMAAGAGMTPATQSVDGCLDLALAKYFSCIISLILGVGIATGEGGVYVRRFMKIACVCSVIIAITTICLPSVGYICPTTGITDPSSNNNLLLYHWMMYPPISR